VRQRFSIGAILWGTETHIQTHDYMVILDYRPVFGAIPWGTQTHIHTHDYIVILDYRQVLGRNIYKCVLLVWMLEAFTTCYSTSLSLSRHYFFIIIIIIIISETVCEPVRERDTVNADK